VPNEKKQPAGANNEPTSDDANNNASSEGGIVVDRMKLVELGSASTEEAWSVRGNKKRRRGGPPRLSASGELPAEIKADIDYDNNDGTVRGGLAAFLRTYVPQVECSKLVRDPNCDCIALVDPGDDDRHIVSRQGVVGGACFRVWRDSPDCIFAELSLLAIEVDYQGRGLASRILAAVEERAKRYRAKSVLTYADARAFAFFKSRGYSPKVTTPRAVWKPKVTDYSGDAVAVEKRLDVAFGELTSSRT
jgi:GNAT superfamily N-acetyltransferase